MLLAAAGSLGLPGLADGRQAGVLQPLTSATAPLATKPPPHAPRGSCPCTSGTPENEPDCGVPTDTINGGCNYIPVHFSPISPGQTVCGTVGTINVNGTDTRDTDWYQFTISTPATLTWTVRAEFDVQIIISAVSCPSITILANVTGTACSDVVASTAVPAGTYIVFVASNFYSGLACDSGSNAYRATLTTTLVNDDCADAVDVSAAGTFAGTLVNATNDGSASCGSSATNADVWYTYTAPACGTLTVTTCGSHDMNGTDSGIDSVLSLHEACGGTLLACNDDWYADYCTGSDAGTPRDSVVFTPVAAGQTILIRVSHFGATLTGPFLLNVSSSTTLSNDTCATPRVLGAGDTPFCTSGATTDGPVNPACRTPLNDVWYRYVATCEGRVTVSTCTGASFDTVLTAYNTTQCSDLTDANVLECNDDAGCGVSGLQSSITFFARTGSAYLIRLGGYQGATGSGVVTVTCNPCPCDFNGDHFLNSQDFFDFLSCFFGAPCPVGSSADVNADSFVNSQDFFDFLSCFFARPSGC